MQNLIIFKFNSLYNILEEINLDLNFKINFIDNENSLKDKIKKTQNYLIISNKKYLDIDNFLVLNDLPLNIFKLIEKINIELLKIRFNRQSDIKIKNYTLNLNSREMLGFNAKVKLTEKEINTIIYLSKANKPVDIEELQKKIWSYQTDTETHTVETHIYRLRKKILDTFHDNEFIISIKNGYKIK
jgi:hypothetical protein